MFILPFFYDDGHDLSVSSLPVECLDASSCVGSVGEYRCAIQPGASLVCEGLSHLDQTSSRINTCPDVIILRGVVLQKKKLSCSIYRDNVPINVPVSYWQPITEAVDRIQECISLTKTGISNPKLLFKKQRKQETNKRV